MDYDDIDLDTYERVLANDTDAIIEGLRAVREYTYRNTPAMYRLDTTDDILAAAIRVLLDTAV